jgi:penicillin G amidase
MRWFRSLSLVLLLLVATAAGGGWIFLRSSLPVTSGTLRLTGLIGPVSIVRDPNGVPAIRAENQHDLYMALGFVHAQDRLFQMDLQRRLAAGRLSEIFGPRALVSDRTMRTLGLYRHAVAGIEFVSPEFKDVLGAYAAGVNAFLNSGARLPIEFTVLNYRPEEWHLGDSLVLGKLLALQLTGNYRLELLRARLAQSLNAAQVNDLFPDYPADGPIALGKLASLTRSLPLDGLLGGLPDAVGPKRASNNWVVDGAHSMTGKPLLANDPHLDYSEPLIWYLVRLEAPYLNLAGATVAGAPVVILGHNDRIAWGYTTTDADAEDLFVERVDPHDPSHYLTPDGLAPFDTLEEQIGVKGQDAQTLTIRATRHGPVISDLASTVHELATAGTVLALRASFLVDGDRSVEAQWRAGQARDWPTWRDALRLFTAPPQNMVYADVDGNIGFLMPGQIPIRKSGDGLSPVPGWTGDYDWAGWIPFDELPQTFNPPVGHIATANNKIVSDAYPYLISHNWDVPYRIERIEAGLAETPRQSIESSTRLQADIVSLTARHLLPLMLAIDPSDVRAKTAMGMLSKWDGRMDATRPEPLIFAAWVRALNKRLYQPALGKLFERFWAPTPLVTEGVLTKHPYWCGDRGCAVALQASLSDALDELSGQYGPDPVNWRWGTAHQALFAHPLFHSIFRAIPLLSDLFDRKVSADGANDTIDAGAFQYANPDGPYTDTHGPALRAIYDLEDLDKSVFLTALGQSAHVLSSHYDDILPRWRRFDWLRLPRYPRGETLMLVPKRSQY